MILYGIALLFVPCFIVGYTLFSTWLGEKSQADFWGNVFGGVVVGLVLYFLIIAGLGQAYGLA